MNRILSTILQPFILFAVYEENDLGGGGVGFLAAVPRVATEKKINTLIFSYNTAVLQPATHYLNLSVFSNTVELDLLIESVVQGLRCGCVNLGSLICSTFISCKRSSSEVSALCICTEYSWHIRNKMKMEFNMKENT